MVYWITGVHNAGKTTIGNSLYYELKKQRDNVAILDGDILKEITTDFAKGEYNKDGRLERAKRYSMLSKYLSDQGITVIICTVSMYEEVRRWNRDKTL